MKMHRQELSVRRLNAIVMPGAGQGVIVAIGLASEGLVSKIAVKQVVPGGTYKGVTVPTPSAAYTVELLDSLPPGYSFTGTPTHGSLIDISGQPLPVNVDLYRVLSQKTASAGDAVVDYATGDEGYAYRNGDNQSSTNNVRLLYLVIIPGVNAPGTVWEMSIVAQNEVG